MNQLVSVAIRAARSALVTIRYPSTGLAVTVSVGLPLVAKPGVFTRISVALMIRRAVYSSGRVTTRCRGRTRIGSPVYGSTRLAIVCSALSTSVQSTRALVAVTLIQGLVAWYVAYVVPFHL